jgi:tetratricopeptide (TPR) repeat protein
VIEPNQRTALAALGQARPTISRLDIARHPEDVAADLIESWNAVEIALRSLLGGSALSGQALIRELRQRELLSLSQAHALIEFLAARDRAGRTEYRPTAADIAAARHGFQELEAGLSAPPAPAVPFGSPAPATALDMSNLSPTPAGGRGRGLLIGGLIVLAVGVGGFFAWRTFATDGVAKGEALLEARRREDARQAFEDAARDNPREAEPHLYLGRMARDDRDMTAALRHLTRAVELEPNNFLVHREMGSYLFLKGDYPLANKFYTRALTLNPADQTSLGYMGCSLVRMGRADLAASFFQRAGQGAWSTCVPRLPGS